MRLAWNLSLMRLCVSVHRCCCHPALSPAEYAAPLPSSHSNINVCVQTRLRSCIYAFAHWLTSLCIPLCHSGMLPSIDHSYLKGVYGSLATDHNTWSAGDVHIPANLCTCHMHALDVPVGHWPFWLILLTVHVVSTSCQAVYCCSVVTWPATCFVIATWQQPML